jgi:D-alanyl-D-alanine carboxypeptidase/D-alanyl-D-alanine-endopeptidase (penicillin-binding protein 4)
VTVDAAVVGRNHPERLPGRSAYAGLVQVAALRSPPFSETIKLILKVSHNLGADIAPLLIAARHGKRTFEEGMALIGSFLERAGLDVKSISLADGQGGERSNLVTPRAVVHLLRRMAIRPDFSAYHDAQPCLGVDGSLAHSVPPESPARGKVYAKTGTTVSGDMLNQRPVLLIKALAGYMTAASGRRLAFGLYVNDILIQELDEIVRVGDDLARIAEVIYLNN